MAARHRPTARTAVLPARRALPEVRRFLPSGRSLLAGLALVAAAGAAYGVARETSLFAVRTIDVRGGTPVLRTRVRTALAGELGTSLVRVDAGVLGDRIGVIPEVHSFTFDRDFPNTLRVVIRREHPVLVVRRVPGNGAFLVAATGRVLRPLSHPRLSHLPRLWVKQTVQLTPGERLPGPLLGAAVAVAALRGAPLPGGVRTVQAGAHGLTLLLVGGFEVRLGDRGDLRLKLAIARRILRVTGAASAGGGYLDVSVPERPVLSANSQVGG